MAEVQALGRSPLTVNHRQARANTTAATRSHDTMSPVRVTQAGVNNGSLEPGRPCYTVRVGDGVT